MKKHDLAQLTTIAELQTEMLEVTVDHLTAIISNSFSALGTIDPELALDILRQLNEHETNLKQLVDSREIAIEDRTIQFEANLPDTIVFEEDYEN